MRRINFVPISCWRLLLVGLSLTLCAGAALAQATPRLEFLQIGEIRPVSMSSKQDIAKVFNGDAKVCEILKTGDPKVVVIKGLAPGSSMVTFVDTKDQKELVEVTTIDPRSNLRKEFLDRVKTTYPGAKDIDVILTGKSANVTGTASDPKTLKGVSEFAKSFFPDAQISINLPDRLRIDFEQLITRTVPGSRVTVFVASGNVVISGIAPDKASIATISQAGRNAFGPDVVVAVQLEDDELRTKVPQVQQVELEVVVALVNRSELRQMSFNWVINRENYFVSSLIGTTTGNPLGFLSGIAPGIVGSSQNAAAGGGNLNFGVVGNRGAFLGFLEALRTEGLAKVLSEPRIVAMAGRKTGNTMSANNVSASGNSATNTTSVGGSGINRPFILSGGEVPVIIATTVGSPPTVQYRQFGTRVEFEPVVLQNGKIQLDIAAELSSRNDANSVNLPTVSAPGFDTRKAETSVLIEDGQTLAIGGLIQNSVQAVSRKVPFLGDIPFLGTAFSATQFRENEEELIVLVTPRLVDPLNCTQIPRRLPGRETRSADDFELFLTQILEAPRGQREVCPDGRFRAAHRNGPTSSIYPCGDNSQGHGWNRGCATGNCGVGSANSVSGAALGQLSIGQNATPVLATEAVPVTTPVNMPETPASLPIPGAATLPPLSSGAPVVDR